MRGLKKKIMYYMIERADSSELSDIVLHVLKRYQELFAEEEVVFLSLPKHDCAERSRIISAVLELEEKRT